MYSLENVLKEYLMRCSHNLILRNQHDILLKNNDIKYQVKSMKYDPNEKLMG